MFSITHMTGSHASHVLIVRLPRWLKRAYMNNNNETLFETHLLIQKHLPFKLHVARNAIRSHVAALVIRHMNGLKPFERTIEQTTETITLALKQ